MYHVKVGKTSRAQRCIWPIFLTLAWSAHLVEVAVDADPVLVRCPVREEQPPAAEDRPADRGGAARKV
jgi:hypothetical protein